MSVLHMTQLETLALQKTFQDIEGRGGGGYSTLRAPHKSAEALATQRALH